MPPGGFLFKLNRRHMKLHRTGDPAKAWRPWADWTPLLNAPGVNERRDGVVIHAWFILCGFVYSDMMHIFEKKPKRFLGWFISFSDMFYFKCHQAKSTHGPDSHTLTYTGNYSLFRQTMSNILQLRARHLLSLTSLIKRFTHHKKPEWSDS